MKNTLILSIILAFSCNIVAQVEWGIGTKWTYDLIDYDSKVGQEVHEPFYYEIIDTAILNGTSCFVLDYGSLVGTYHYLFTDENDVYFYNEALDDFILSYSFENDTQFISAQAFGGDGHRIDFEVTIDTTYSENINGNLLDVSEYSVQRNDSIFIMQDPQKVFNQIGFEYWSMLPTGLAPVTIGTHAFDKIRCFENNGNVINFQNYPCDTIFGLTTSTQDPFAEKIQISPNPSSGQFSISNCLDCEYSIFSVQGKLIDSGSLNTEQLRIDKEGLYYVQLLYNNTRVVRRIIVQ